MIRNYSSVLALVVDLQPSCGLELFPASVHAPSRPVESYDLYFSRFRSGWPIFLSPAPFVSPGSFRSVLSTNYCWLSSACLPVSKYLKEKRALGTTKSIAMPRASGSNGSVHSGAALSRQFERTDRVVEGLPPAWTRDDELMNEFHFTRLSVGRSVAQAMARLVRPFGGSDVDTKS